MSKKKFILLSTLLIVLISLPILISLLFFKTPTMIPTGLVNGSNDILSYYEKINNGKYFDSLRFLVRSNHQLDIDGGYLFMFYSIFGLTLGNLGIQTGLIYYLMKIMFSIFFCCCLYKFLKEFVEEKQQMFVATLIMFMPSITNLFVYILQIFNVEFTGVTFALRDIFLIDSCTYIPHFAFVSGLLLLSFINVKKYNSNKIKYSIINGIIYLLISLIHPQIAVFYGLLSGIYLLTEIKKRSYKIKDLLPISLWGLIPLPYLIYCIYIFKNNYPLIVWLEKNNHPYTLTFLLTFILPFVIILIINTIKNKKFIQQNKLIMFWVIGVILTCFIPGKYQIKMTESISIPAFILLSNIIYNSKRYKTKIVLTIVTIPILLFPTLFSMFIPKYTDLFLTVPVYYNNLYRDIDTLEYPSIIYANNHVSTLCLGHTKQLFPVAIPDESQFFKEYNTMYENAVQTKDFSFLNDIDVDYYIYDKYIAGLNDTIEVESNLPYEKYKETENYIIYKIKEE